MVRTCNCRKRVTGPRSAGVLRRGNQVRIADCEPHAGWFHQGIDGVLHVGIPGAAGTAVEAVLDARNWGRQPQSSLAGVESGAMAAVAPDVKHNPIPHKVSKTDRARALTSHGKEQRAGRGRGER